MGQEQRENGPGGRGCWVSPWRTQGSILSSVRPQPASTLFILQELTPLGVCLNLFLFYFVL